MSTSPPIFTATSAYSLAFVSAVGVVAYLASKALLPKNARWQDRFTFVWLVSLLNSVLGDENNAHGGGFPLGF